MAIGTPYLVGSNADKTASSTLVIAVGSTASGSTGTAQSSTAGDFLILGAGIGSAASTATGVTDSQGNTWTNIPAAGGSNTTAGTSTMWYTAGAAALVSGTDTITVTYNTAVSQEHTAACIGCSGLDGTVDTSTSANATTGSPSVTSATLANASELLVAFETNHFSGGNITWGGSFTSLAGTIFSLSNPHVSIAYLIVSSTAAVTASGTITSDVWVINLASFPAAAGGTSPNAGLAASTGVPPGPAPTVTLGMTIQGV